MRLAQSVGGIEALKPRSHRIVALLKLPGVESSGFLVTAPKLGVRYGFDSSNHCRPNAFVNGAITTLSRRHLLERRSKISSLRSNDRN
jgi:hypothetical protein